MTVDSKGSRLHVDLPGRGHALFTTGADGNLSSVGGLDHEHGHDVRERLRAQLGLRRLARGYQAHGTTVLRSKSNIMDCAIIAPATARAGFTGAHRLAAAS